MYPMKVTVEIKDQKELTDFVVKMGGLSQNASIEPSTSVAEPAPAKPKARGGKKAAAPEVEAQAPQTFEHGSSEQMEDVPSPFAPSPTSMTQAFNTAPQVQQAAAKVDRDALLTGVKAQANSLITAGLPQTQLPALFNEILAKIGAPVGTQVSLLDDQSLSRFAPALEARVKELFAQAQLPGQAAPQHSYI